MNTLTVTPANFTRRTVDLPAKFKREGRFALIPLYHFLRLSELAREGIEHSGSYRFADHVYRNEAAGTGWFGRWLDRRLLNLPAAQAMRSRYWRACEEMHRACTAHFAAGRAGTFRMLTVPCGIPRDVRDFAGKLVAESPERCRQVEYDGMDLDPVVCETASAFLASSVLQSPRVFRGNALDQRCYGAGQYHLIASTGLGEFLSDEDISVLYGNVFEALAPGGVFFTSATAFDRRSDALLRTFELNSHYRNRADLQRLLARQPWDSVEFEEHPTGLQTFVRAIKP
jgi:hypothetical protein